MISGATTATGYLIKPVIDDIFVNRDTTGLIVLPLLVVAVFLIKGLGSYGQEYFMNYVGEDIIRRLRNQLYDRIQDLSLAFFQKERTGTLMSRITNDVNILKAMVSSAVTGSLRDVSTIIGLTAVIFYQNWRMAIIAFHRPAGGLLAGLYPGTQSPTGEHRMSAGHGRTERVSA
jgi:subfamily B ATP-binding cassette protein MsbA